MSDVRVEEEEGWEGALSGRWEVQLLGVTAGRCGWSRWDEVGVGGLRGAWEGCGERGGSRLAYAIKYARECAKVGRKGGHVFEKARTTTSMFFQKKRALSTRASQKTTDGGPECACF